MVHDYWIEGEGAKPWNRAVIRDLDVLRPGWLASNDMWEEYLSVMTVEDIRFFSESWKLAGGKSAVLERQWPVFTRAYI